ncbi:Lsr2 family DNA-binding protein [Streptomyces sp. BH097]|uniref:Lsr2 family DNA-binding protein n=1 Tax=unclassified Streptomyces TaxID=2593676 RepID=UPI003BB56BAE
MFNDWQQALEAEGLPLNPNPVEQQAAAARTVARHAASKEDLVLLLDAVGLPGDDNTLTTLLPLLPSPTRPELGDPMPVNAYTATAASMLNNGDSPDHVRDTLGLSEHDLAAAVEAASEASRPAAPAADEPIDDGIEALLAWATEHDAAAIRNKAARIRSDLSELTARRSSEAAVGQAETEVARLAAELDKAKAQLKVLKTSGHGSKTTAAAATPIRATRSKEENARIRAWGRANGYEVGQGGVIKQAVVDAFEAAQQSTNARAEAS